MYLDGGSNYFSLNGIGPMIDQSHDTSMQIRDENASAE